MIIFRETFLTKVNYYKNMLPSYIGKFVKDKHDNYLNILSGIKNIIKNCSQNEFENSTNWVLDLNLQPKN